MVRHFVHICLARVGLGHSGGAMVRHFVNICSLGWSGVSGGPFRRCYGEAFCAYLLAWLARVGWGHSVVFLARSFVNN